MRGMCVSCVLQRWHVKRSEKNLMNYIVSPLHGFLGIELMTLGFCSHMSLPAESFFHSLYIILKGRALIEVGLTVYERNIGLENPKC